MAIEHSVQILNFEYGYYFSPGFFSEYWLNYIQEKVEGHDSFASNKMKKYQELWVGSIFAALYTKSTGEKYFVGLPEKDPPDVWLVRHVPIVRNGRECLKSERIPVEITRCHLDKGEHLFTQISNKNKPSNDNFVLLVYLYGKGKTVSFTYLVEQIAKMDKIHPAEFFVIAKTYNCKDDNLKHNTFVGTMVYPEYRQQTVDLSDHDAFFKHPEVIRQKLGISREVKMVGIRTLAPPNTNN